MFEETVNKAKNFQYVLRTKNIIGHVYSLLDTENISENFDKCFYAASESNTDIYRFYMML